MSLEEGEVLSDCLMKIPKQNIRHIVSQLASAARFLEELGFAHRDIKPENIILTDLDACNIKILDFGVLRPVGASSLTDGPEHTPFVGTHQYSPPEMLHRTEEQTSEAWRAITFYQIGAVIHDLLTQRPLFEEDKEPYANLVVAVDTKYPEFDVTIEDRELVGLAKRCLLKKPSDRLELVQWQDFLFKNKEAFDSKDERLTRLVRLQKTRLAEQPLQPLERREINRLAQRRAGELITVLRTRVESVLDEFAGKLPPRVITVEQIFYPSITLCCNFVKDKTLAFDKNLNIQLALKRADGSSAVQVYVRSAEATVAVPDWLCLGGFTADLFGLNEAFANWLLGVLEKILEA
jgi:serine/threonine protein kinase